MQGVLEQIGLRAGLERAQRLHIAGIGGQHDDARLRELAADRNDRIEPAHLRHLQIHQRDVGTVRAKLLDGLAPVGGLGDHLHVRLSSDQSHDALADERMIIHRKDPDGGGFAAHDSLGASSLRFVRQATHGQILAVCAYARSPEC